VGEWRRRRKSKSAENRTKSKVSLKSSQSVSQKPVTQTEVPWRPQLGGLVASSVQVSRKSEEVENQSEVESVSQPETSQSAGSALAATIRWASGVVEGSPSQPPKIEGSRKSARSRVSQPETSQSAGSALAATIRWASGVVERSPSQPITERSRKSARSRVSQSARNQSVNRKCPGGHNLVD